MSTTKKTNKTKAGARVVKVSLSLTKDLASYVSNRVENDPDPQQNFSRYVRGLILNDRKEKATA